MVLEVLTTLEVLHKGLLTVGYDQAQLDRVGMRKNVSRFGTNYVSHPRILTQNCDPTPHRTAQVCNHRLNHRRQ